MSRDHDLSWIDYSELMEDITLFHLAQTSIRDEHQHSYTGIHTDEQLQTEADALYPYVRQVCGPFAEVPAKASFQGDLEKRIWSLFGGQSRSFNADPSSYSIGLGKIIKRLGIPTARLNPRLRSENGNEKRIHGVLAHELAHCASSNESATQLRGLEINARRGLDGHLDSILESYRMLERLAVTTMSVKAITEGKEQEVLDRAGEDYGPWLHQRISANIDFQRSRATRGDFYKAIAYDVQPYQTIKRSLENKTTQVEVPDAPPFSKEDFFPSFYEMLRKAFNKPKEDPIDMHATIHLYERATRK